MCNHFEDFVIGKEENELGNVVISSSIKSAEAFAYAFLCTSNDSTVGMLPRNYTQRFIVMPLSKTISPTSIQITLLISHPDIKPPFLYSC